MSWQQLGRFLRIVFLLRVPLLTLILLGALGPLGLTAAEQLLGNLLDQEVVIRKSAGDWIGSAPWTYWSLFSVTFSAFLLSFTAIAVINLILLYGEDRFQDPAIKPAPKRPLLTFLLGMVPAFILAACVSYRTVEPGLIAKIVLPLLGLLAALVFVVLAKVAQLAFTDPDTTPHPPPYLVFPAYRIRALEKYFDALYCWHSGFSHGLKRIANQISQWPLEILRGAGQGYLVNGKANRGELQLRSGHVFALAMSALAIIAYWVIGFAKSKIDVRPAAVPALAFVLLWLIVICWVLGALSFFFDRYRFPLLWCIGLLSFSTTFSPVSDHFFQVAKRDASHLLRPSDVLRSRKQPHNRLVLVATAGGGIQASAWTAKILTELEKACPYIVKLETTEAAKATEAEDQCDFRDSLALISSVSGGSLGAMAYTRSYLPDFLALKTTDRTNEVLHSAEAAALDEAAWGWTNPDFARSIVPWVGDRITDRGWALEKKWSAINQLDYNTFLTDWAREISGGMPALLLNSTVVETGRPVTFSTTTFPHYQDSRRIMNFYDFYLAPKSTPGDQARASTYDVRVSTAVRLSASFPYVAPAARSDAYPPATTDYHLVDGGYYDNFGIMALLGWLEDAIKDRDPETQYDILIIEIRPFHTGAEAPRSKHGWGYQIIAPINGLMAVRDSGQAAHDASELGEFAKYYETQKIHLWTAAFEFPDRTDFTDSEASCRQEPPLSWKMSQDQKKCIDIGWERLLQKNPQSLECVKSYLKGEPAGSFCTDAARNPWGR